MGCNKSEQHPIAVTIYGTYGGECPTVAIRPTRSETWDLFNFHDPFRLRRAVVPVLVSDEDQTVRGMGTAFHVDGWGTFLTADHVIYQVRHRSTWAEAAKQEAASSQAFTNDPPVLLLGYGIAYGRTGLPADALAIIKSMRTPMRERDDPLAALSGRSRTEAAADIAVLEAGRIPEKLLGAIGIRLSGIGPRVGDRVVALGFPELQCQPLDAEGLRYLLSDGMSASYGHIVAVHPKGLRGDPTPVIEVEANWPSGMSGGPVLNERGEVVAVISRSWTPSAEASGRGCAACLQLMPWLRQWLPTVDAANPGWRVGWGVVKTREDLFGIYASEAEARRHQQSLGSQCSVVFGSNRIGSDDFIPASSPSRLQL